MRLQSTASLKGEYESKGFFNVISTVSILFFIIFFLWDVTLEGKNYWAAVYRKCCKTKVETFEIQNPIQLILSHKGKANSQGRTVIGPLCYSQAQHISTSEYSENCSLTIFSFTMSIIDWSNKQ